MLDALRVFEPGFRITDSNGNPESGATITFYLEGTSTLMEVFSDDALSVSLGSTVTCDSGGYPTSNGSTRCMIYTGLQDFKVAIYYPSSGTTITHDNLPGAVASASLGGGMTDWETDVTAVNTDTTLTSTHYGQLLQANPTGGTFQLTLPSAVTATNGTRIGARHNGTANQVKIATVSGQYIKTPGSSTTAGVALTALGHTMWLVSDGAGWVLDLEVPPIGSGILVIADRLTAAPTSPTAGARYIVNGTPTGSWLTASHALHDVLEADGQGGWIRYRPATDCGWFAYVQDENLYTAFVGTAWSDQTGMTAPSASNLRTMIVEDVKAQGTAGGSSVATTWTARTLNTATVNTITTANGATSDASLLSNATTLPTGRYRVHAIAPFIVTNMSRMRWISTSNASKVIYSQPLNIVAANTDRASLHLMGEFEVTAASEAFELQYYTATAVATTGLGEAQNLSGVSEIYARVLIEDLDSLQGPAGAAGTQGITGRDAGVGRWTFSTTTTSGPATGTLRLNHATISSATAVFINETDADSRSLASEIATWDDSTSTIKTKLVIYKQDSPGDFAIFNVTALSDIGTSVTLTATYVTHSGSFSASDSLVCLPIRTGDLGATGADGGIPYTYSTNTTTAADPTAGLWRANNATLASATELSISYSSAATGNPSIANYVKTWDDSDSTIKGTLTITKAGAPQNVAIYQITALNDQTTYGRFTVSNIASAGSFSNSDSVLFVFSRTGDKGATGSTGPAGTITVGTVTTGAAGSSVSITNSGTSTAATLNFTIPRGDTGSTGSTGAAGPGPVDYTWDTGTTAADPGTGKLRANNANLSSATALYINETDRLGNGLAAYLQTWDDSTSTAKGVLEIVDTTTPANRVYFSVTGSITDNGTYDTVTVTYLSGVTSFSAGNVALLFYRTGDKGADGAGTGDFSSNTATSVDSELVLFSGTGGKTGKRATTTGILKGTSGVLSAASAGTDYVAPGGALGTPSSGTLTNATGLPISTGVSGLGTGVATFLATPSSANLAAALTDETGSGAAVFANSPTLVTPALGTPSAINLTNGTALPVSGITSSTSTALGVGSLELGHASDTTLARSAAGEVTIEGTLVKKVGKETIWIPASAMTARTTNGAASGTLEMTTNKNMFATLDFDTTTQEFAQFEIHMPKSWNLGTVTFQPVWSHASTTTNFGVVWALSAVARSDDDAGDVAFGTAQTSTDTGGTTNDIYIAPESGSLTVGGSPLAGDTVQFQIQRNPGDASDTLAIDARLHGLRLFFTTNASTDA